jgi:hypothetical protein
MKKNIILILSFLLLLPGLARANTEKAVVSAKNYAPIVIDGKLDDWVGRIESSNWGAMLDIKKGKIEKWMRAYSNYMNSLVSRVEAGKVDSPSDFSMIFYTMWDEQNLYFAAVVTDSEVMTQHEGENIWQDDCVEIWLDGRHDAVTHTLTHDDEYQIGISPKSKYRDKTIAWAWRNPKSEPVMAAMKYASTLTEGGYIVEVAIPFSVLEGFNPKIGSAIGFNVSAVDKDEDEVWSHITWSGTLHSDPTQFADLYFVDAPIVVFNKDLVEAAEDDKQ